MSQSGSGPVPDLCGVDFATARDWTAKITGPVNGDRWPAGKIRLSRIESQPVYGSLWRWLLRKPRYFNLTNHFVIEPDSST